jgi:exodeoxyribonuclease V alpha subunit
VDEASMVALPLMARLFEALPPHATLVLVGDPFQLASVEAGTVLADIIGPAREDPDAAALANPPLADSIVVLRTNHRFDEGSTIAAAASAILSRDIGAVTTALSARPNLDDARSTALDHATEVALAARSGDVAGALGLVDRLGFLCATWNGPGGVDAVNAAVAEGLVDRLADVGAGRTTSPGSVVMVTTNNPAIDLFNGDVGVVCVIDGRTRVAFAGTDGPRPFPPHVIGETIPAWAITVHRSQGSEYDHVIVSLPDAPSPLLTRELLYTAVTRARTEVEVVGSDEALAEAVDRDIRRASGLRDRLWGERPSARVTVR